MPGGPQRGQHEEVAPVPSVRRLNRYQWREYRDLRLRALADSPDAFTTTLAQAQARTDTDWSNQVTSGAESPAQIALVAEIGLRLVGLAWGGIDSTDPRRVYLTQMWVDPGFRGIGVGRKLLGNIIGWARSVNAELVLLSVTSGNSSAKRLYKNAGFEPVGRSEPLRPGSDLLMQPMRLELARRHER